MTDDRDSSADLERATVARLRSEGLLRSEPVHSWPRTAAMLAGLLAVPVLALILLNARSDPPPGQIYVLALYEGAAGQRPDASQLHARAREYREWARTRSVGTAVVVGGQELHSPIATLGGMPSADPELVGYFEVRANSGADAIALARTTPHLRYGGTVSVRPVGN